MTGMPGTKALDPWARTCSVQGSSNQISVKNWMSQVVWKSHETFWRITFETLRALFSRPVFRWSFLFLLFFQLNRLKAPSYPKQSQHAFFESIHRRRLWKKVIYSKKLQNKLETYKSYKSVSLVSFISTSKFLNICFLHMQTRRSSTKVRISFVAGHLDVFTPCAPENIYRDLMRFACENVRIPIITYHNV